MAVSEGKSFEDGLQAKLEKHFRDFYRREMPEQNAGLAKNLVEQAIQRHAARQVDEDAARQALREQAKQELVADPGLKRTVTQHVRVLHAAASAPAQLSPEQEPEPEALHDDNVLIAEDFDISSTPQLGDRKLQAEIKQEVDGMIGAANMKLLFAELEETAKYVEAGGNMKILQTSLHMVITGNPGTGKTTCARLLARYLYALGILPHDRFVEKNALELKGAYVGQTTPRVIEAVKTAMGGCLFLDEAYSLAGGDVFSGEAVRTLLTEVENNRTNLFCCLAGYQGPMRELMRADPGLPRRFATTLHLQDYTAHEIAEICKQVALKRFELTITAELLERLADWIEKRHGHEIAQHNGGIAVNLVEQAFRRLGKRVRRAKPPLCGDDANALVAADFRIEEVLSVDEAEMLLRADVGLEGFATPEDWKTPEVVEAKTLADILGEVGLPDHERLFVAAGVTDDVLGDLDDEGLKEIGVEKYGERLRILKCLRGHGMLDEY